MFLSAGKLGVGVACHSSALIADAGHSLSDLFSDLVTLWAVSVGRLPPDEDHPYGHGKFEAVGSLFLSLTLLGTGLGIGLLSNQKLLEILRLQRQGAAAAATPLPGIAALAMAGISVMVKEWLFRITRRVGERLQSNVVIANAWHHRSDAYSSILALASIALARYVPGLVFVDATAGLLVGATIGMTGAEILGDSINALTDRHPEAVGQAVTAAAQEHPAVAAVTHIKARPVGSMVNVDVDVDVVPLQHTGTKEEDRATTTATAKDIQQHIEQSCSSGATGEPAVHVRVHTHPVEQEQAEETVRTIVQDTVPAGITCQKIHRPAPGAVDVVLAAATESTTDAASSMQSVAPKLQQQVLQSMEGVETVHIYLDLLHPAAVAPSKP